MKAQLSKQRRLTTIAAALAIVLGTGLVMAYPEANTTSPPISANNDQRYQGPMNFSELVERVKPAVVNISTTGTTNLAKSMGDALKLPNLPEGSPFGDMFQRFFESTPGQPQGGDRQFEQRAAGSGFIISATGYVVTSNHVVEHADEIEVILDDGTHYPAKLRGRDPETDLALLKVEADRDLPFVELGDSDGAKIGEWVVAVGNPFGLGGTVTAGIISARGRDLRSGPYDDYLQVDAPINRGNSGGPLFDTEGNVIGINTAIYSPTGGSVGIGFAVPSSTAKDIIAQLRADGRIERGWLGVQIQPVTQEVEQGFDLPGQHGALVASVVPDSPAAQAGIQPGDVIYKMNDERLDGFKDLSKRVANMPGGTDVRFEIWRKGEARLLTVELESMPSEEPKLASSEIEAREDSARLGIFLAELTPEARKRFRISEQSSGVLVAEVEQDSPADKAGIRSGSVIEMVDQEAVSSPKELAAKVQEAAAEERSSVLLLVTHEGKKRFVAVKFATA